MAALRGAPDGSGGGAAVPRVQARRRAAGVRALSYVKRLPHRVRPRRGRARAVVRASKVALQWAPVPTVRCSALRCAFYCKRSECKGALN